MMEMKLLGWLAVWLVCGGRMGEMAGDGFGSRWAARCDVMPGRRSLKPLPRPLARGTVTTVPRKPSQAQFDAWSLPVLVEISLNLRRTLHDPGISQWNTVMTAARAMQETMWPRHSAFECRRTRISRAGASVKRCGTQTQRNWARCFSTCARVVHEFGVL